jgi:hypothetical protein
MATSFPQRTVRASAMLVMRPVIADEDCRIGNVATRANVEISVGVTTVFSATAGAASDASARTATTLRIILFP